MKKFELLYYRMDGETKILNHIYQETWDRIDYYCPNCGSEGSVWKEQGPEDEDIGNEYICVSCGCSFHLPTGINILEDDQHKQRLHNLRK